RTRVAHVADQLTAFNTLAFTNGEVVHVRITRTISEAVIDLEHLTVAGEFYLHFVDDTVCRGVDRCADGSREVDAVVHLLHFVDRVETEAISGGKAYQQLV